MANENLKKNITQILDELRKDGSKLVENFEKSLQKYQKILIKEFSKSKNKK